MAVFFSETSRNRMLDDLNTFVNPSSGYVADGFSVQAYSLVNAGGTLVSYATITIGSATNAQRTNTNSPTMTIPASGEVRSIALSTYDGGANQNLSLVGHKNLAEPLIYVSAGTLQITSLTIAIVNPT